MFKRILLLLTFSLAFVGCSEESPKIIPSSEASVEEVQNITKEKLLIAINKVRSQQIDCHDGLGLVGPYNGLRWNNELFSSAYEHSTDLALSDTFSHFGSGTEYDITGSNLNTKSSFVERIEANGYLNYKTIGENIAGGFSSIDETIIAWLKSPKHCANIMNSNFTDTGIAISVNPDSEYKVYWSQNFGSKI